MSTVPNYIVLKHHFCCSQHDLHPFASLSDPVPMSFMYILHLRSVIFQKPWGPSMCYQGVNGVFLLHGQQQKFIN